MTTDKRRIDACLKACEGISTQNLEDNVPFLELARRYNVVLRERDALRAAQQLALEVLENVRGNINPERGYADELEADVERAIAAIEQPAPNVPDGSAVQTAARIMNVELITERDALRAKIEAMAKQEPVAFALYSGWARKAVYLSEIEACEQRDRRQLTANLGGSLEAYKVVPLYLAPGAKGE